MIDDLLGTPEFQHWQWDLAVRMRRAVEQVYAEGPDEVRTVEAMVDAVSGVPRATSPSEPRTFVEVESAFLHGSRSQVTFEIGGKKQQRELADLLVVASLVQDGQLYGQRVCFVQAKRASRAGSQSPSRFEIDPWQLALLRAFPEFTGVAGVFMGQTLHLRNRSGMLGAYGFLAAPGELSIVSARIVDHVLGGRKSVAGKEFIPAFLVNPSRRPAEDRVRETSSGWLPFDPERCEKCAEILHHWWGLPGHHFHRNHGGSASTIHHDAHLPDATELSCIGMDSFVDAWTELRLGEPWRTGTKVASDVSLGSCILGLVSAVSSATGKLGTLHGLLTAAHGDRPPHRGDPEAPRKGSIAVLSAIAHTSSSRTD